MPPVKKMQSINLEGELTLSTPVEMADRTRFSQAKCPYIQTPALPICFDSEKKVFTLLCTEEYADFMQLVDDMMIDLLSQNSELWFGKHIRTTEVESMLKPSIKGHRCPKQIMPSGGTKCFDSELKECEIPGEQFSGVVIIQIRGVSIDEKKCEVAYKVLQIKKYEEPPERLGDDENLEGAAFVN